MSATTGIGAVRAAAADQQHLAVAFQGERGAWSDLAIERVWGARARRVACWDFAGVVTAVLSGAAGYGVLPVHNSTLGNIPGIAEVLARTPLQVEEYIEVPVVHCLLAAPGATLEGLRSVYSHPAALGQCRDFFFGRPWLTAVETYDTAGAAREVAARRQLWEGAVASELCAVRYGLRVLDRDVADCRDNRTRFAILIHRP